MKNSELLLITLISVFIIASCSDEMYSLDGINNIGADLPYNDSDANRRLNAAVVTMHCDKEKQKNIESIEQMITKIKSEVPTIDMIIFGETTLGYYYFKNDPKNYQRALAEEIPGETSEYIAQLAVKNSVAIVFGMGELFESRMYNSSVFIDKNGSINIAARKHILIDKDKQSGYSSGKSGNIIVFNGINLGFIICSDNNSKELIDNLIEADTDIVIHIVAGGGEDQQKTYARAIDAWVIQANRYGREDNTTYEGFSGINAPTGYTKASISNREGYACYDIGVYK